MDAITIQANPSGIKYRIGEDCPYFGAIKTAKLGMVVHTVAKRKINHGNTEIGVECVEDSGLVKNLVSSLSSRNLFLTDPWRVSEEVANSESFTAEVEARIGARLMSIERSFLELSEDFRNGWPKVQRQLQIFFNADLYPPNKGGLYRAAASGQDFNFNKLINDFYAL